MIVEKIHEQPDGTDRMKYLYDHLVVPCIRMIEQGENEAARTLYRTVVLELRDQYEKGSEG